MSKIALCWYKEASWETYLDFYTEDMQNKTILNSVKVKFLGQILCPPPPPPPQMVQVMDLYVCFVIIY